MQQANGETMMDAVEIREAGGPDVLQPCQRPIPEITPQEVLIKVEAAGVNRPDVLQRKGAYPPPKGASELPGLEVAGTIVATGSETWDYRRGDRVVALTNGGGYAQYVAVDEGSVLPVPDGLDMVQAAGLPETFFTVWHNVFERGRLASGETFLVHGGTSGIGTTAIQLAKVFGATVITTAGSDNKCDACRLLGADRAVNYRTADFVEAAKELTDGRGVDLILDMVGGDYVNRNYRASAMDGRIVQIAFLAGSNVEADLSLLMGKRLHHTGSTLRARDTAFKAAIARQLREKVWPLIAEGRVKPLIDTVYPLKDAAQAHERMEASEHIGKIVLAVG